MLNKELGSLHDPLVAPSPPTSGLSPARAVNDVLSLVEENPRLRHPHQFEIKLRYALPREKGKAVYNLSVYFFLPPSLGISRANYDKERFYEDLQSYIRLKTPEVPLKDISRGDASPLSQLNAAALRLSGDSTERSIRLYEYQSKLFCCVLKSSLREHLELVEAENNPIERTRLVDDYQVAVHSVRSMYLALQPRLCNPGMLPQVQSMYRFTDEYISLMLDEYTCRLVSVIEKDERNAKLQSDLIEFIKREVAHRKEENYPSITNPSSDNESFIYRRGVLKKYMSSVLFLSRRDVEGGRFLREGLLGLAAGVSMVFATAVLFLSTVQFGTLTWPVFFALVVSYIFKDRIKERMRVYLSRKAGRWLFDRRTTLYAGTADRIGICEESVDFLEASMVPAAVTAVRNRTHMTEIEGGWIGERAIRYRKLVKLFPVRITDIYDEPSMSDINDIMRIGIEEFVHHLGPVDKPVPTLVGDRVELTQCDRVHHLNVVLRYEKDGSDVFHRFRVVLNREGIKRIEPIPETGVAHQPPRY